MFRAEELCAARFSSWLRLSGRPFISLHGTGASYDLCRDGADKSQVYEEEIVLKSMYSR